jgi:transposase
MRMIETPAEFLKSCFKRNLSESGFFSDKNRFRWLETAVDASKILLRKIDLISQKKDDRRESALFCAAALHNIFFVRRAMN